MTAAGAPAAGVRGAGPARADRAADPAAADAPAIEAAAAGDAVASPCTNVCRIDPASGWCEGCRRTIDEIVAWPGLDADAKRAVWRAIAQRGGVR